MTEVEKLEYVNNLLLDALESALSAIAIYEAVAQPYLTDDEKEVAEDDLYEVLALIEKADKVLS